MTYAYDEHRCFRPKYGAQARASALSAAAPHSVVGIAALNAVSIAARASTADAPVALAAASALEQNLAMVHGAPAAAAARSFRGSCAN